MSDEIQVQIYGKSIDQKLQVAHAEALEYLKQNPESFQNPRVLLHYTMWDEGNCDVSWEITEEKI